jgi:Na+-translocating ferredoxin:NAD+ oxidoreductase RNF subunit RnfB
MDWLVVGKAVAALGGAGLLIAVLLLVASLKLAVKVDEREAAVRAVLPGANCGACGFPGCDGYAAAVAGGKAPLNSCSVGGASVARAIGEIMGQDAGAIEPRVAVLICRGGKEVAPQRFEYKGARDCREAALLLGGPKACIYGCVGLGHCASVCPFEAITMGDNNLPVIDEKKCTACGKCVKECPKSVLVLLPRAKLVYLACASHDKGRTVKEVCRVGCIACGLCVKNCPTGALALVNNLPVMDFAKCIDCGICVHKCPTKSFIDRAKGRPKAVINPKCTGCQLCVKACPFKAIEGEVDKQHKVAADKCIGCGECRKVCPASAIDMVGALGHSVRAA